MVEYPRKPKFRSTYDPTGRSGGGESPPEPPRPKPPAGKESKGAAGAPPGSAGPPEPKRPPGGAPPREKPPGQAAGRTAMPPRQRIRCFECGYDFNLTGRMHSTYCPKCRTTLDLAGYTIDSDCEEPLKTLGTIRITKRGKVNSSRLVATDIELEGHIKNTPSKIFGTLVVHPGAHFARKDIEASDLRILAGAEIRFEAPAVYRNVEIAGSFEADLYATGVVTIRDGGTFSGTLHARHLVVEDGGILLGEMDISDDGLELAQTKREAFVENPPEGLEREKIAVPALPEPEEEDGSPAEPAD